MRETSARTAVPERRLRLALAAARRFDDEELEVLEQLLNLERAGLSRDQRRSVSRALSKTIAALGSTGVADPLAVADEPLSSSEAAKALLEAEVESQARRETMLQHCVSAAEAGRLIQRSRQAIERLRRSGRLLALRVRSQWRYPRWQFEPDAPGGVVPGLVQVLERLPLSPAGVAFWLTRPSERLGGKSPIEALRRNQRDVVLRLVDDQARLP